MRPGVSDNNGLPHLPEQLQIGSQDDAGSHGGITEHIVAAPIGQSLTDGRFLFYPRKSDDNAKVTIKSDDKSDDKLREIADGRFFLKVLLIRIYVLDAFGSACYNCSML